jgi:opacity protein-like surface antigen
LLVIGSTAHASDASSPFSHDTSVTLGVDTMQVINSDDDAVDFGGNHPLVALEAGFRIRTGTEAFATLGFGLGGHESIFGLWGVGLRQHLRFGRMEPYLQGGVFHVGDGDKGPTALALGAGVDYRFSPRWSAGLAGGHYFSEDSDTSGGLDWYATARLMWRKKL